MRQQINLFQDILLDKPQPLQSRQAGLIVLIVLLVLGGFALFGYRQARSAAGQAAELRQQFAAASARVEELERQYPEPQKDPLLEEKIRRLEQEVGGRKQALGYLSSRDGGGNRKLLGMLEGLARHPLPGVWLNRIRLGRQGEDIGLDGSAVNAEKIPDYLSLLAEQEVFEGKVFARLHLSRVEKRAGQVDFMLESVEEK